MSTKLINKGNFAEFKTLSNGVDVEKIEQFITEAQDLDLTEIMCSAFFYDLVKNYQVPKYQKFIHGDTYDDADGNTIEFKGLKAVLVYFAWSRYVLRGHVQDTAFNMVQKKTDFSEPISDRERRDMHDRGRQDAMRYWPACIKYLNDKKDDFTVWKEKCIGCGASPRRKLNIDKIG